jgi:hypothetical protein
VESLRDLACKPFHGGRTVVKSHTSDNDSVPTNFLARGNIMRLSTGSGRKPEQPMIPTRNGIIPRAKNGWSLLVAVLCVLGVLMPSVRSYGAGQAAPTSQASVSPSFNFDRFTKYKRFKLNTLQTTPYGPAWADILQRPENFLACRGAPIALCYYSGPGPVTSCQFAPGKAVANCSCYEIPAGSTYFIDINAILNLDVYLDTVKTCGLDGGNCLPRGPNYAPACAAVNSGTMIPGADLISTFSYYLNDQIPISQSSCATPALYAGCMTAPCTRTGATDPTTGQPIVQCACPTFEGPYQVGQDLSTTGQSCVLGDNQVWSSAYATFEDGTIPKPPENGCLPDVPGGNGCPLLSPKPPVIPAVPSSVSCTQVCAEYGKSIHQGVEVGFTCDATLCTAQPDDSDLVQEACTGLGDSSVAEILKLETLVGRSCSASQICGCAPNKKTNQKMFDLNKRQRARNIAPQCDLNAPLCGAKF